MKIVIAGCRDYNNYDEAEIFIEEVLHSFIDINEITIVSGNLIQLNLKFKPANINDDININPLSRRTNFCVDSFSLAFNLFKRFFKC